MNIYQLPLNIQPVSTLCVVLVGGRSGGRGPALPNHVDQQTFQQPQR